MPDQVICPSCAEVHQRPTPKLRENPERCEHCGTELNIVTLTAKIPVASHDGHLLDEAIDMYVPIGSWYMDQYRMRINRIARHIVTETASGVCVLCGQNRKKLQFQTNKGLACIGCMWKKVFSKDEHKIMVSAAQCVFLGVERKTYFQLAAQKAKEFASPWLSRNVVVLADQKVRARYLAGRKAKAKALPPDNEEPEIVRIRAEWADGPVSQCLLQHFRWYILGRKFTAERPRPGQKIPKIDQKHRTPRIKRLRKLNAAVGHRSKDSEISDAHPLKKRRAPKRKIIPNVAHALIKRVCADDCPYLERYEWGWECELEDRRKHPRPSKFPLFPHTILDMQGQHKIMWPDLEDGDDEHAAAAGPMIELRLWEPNKKGRQGRKMTVPVPGSEFLKRYDLEAHPDSIYVDLWRREDVVPHQYYILDHITKVVPVRQGTWMHIVVGLPRATCVVSVSPEEEHVRYFGHGIIAAWKEYYAAQRVAAQRRGAGRSYFRRSRRTESRRSALLIHEETSQICRMLQDMPGRVMLVQLHKRPYRREALEGRRLNRTLNGWPEYVFRQYQRYKSEAAGFSVNEVVLNFAEDACCPYCERELGKSWQNMVVLDRVKNLQCACGKEFNILLGLAKTVQRRMAEKARCSHCSTDAEQTWYDLIVRDLAHFVECGACTKTYKPVNAFAKYSNKLSMGDQEELPEDGATAEEGLFVF